MTLCAAYKEGEITIFLSDFRVTETENYKDISEKFIAIDGRIGLFIAGDVQQWKEIIKKIEEKKNEITFDNILDEDGIFREILIGFGLSKQSKRGNAIGFIIEENQKTNKVFKIDIVKGRGATVEKISDNAIETIGSLPGDELKSKIDKIVEYNSMKFNDSYQKISFIREEILKYIKEDANNDFEKLGITPMFQVAILEKDFFEIPSEDICNIYKEKGKMVIEEASIERKGNKVVLSNLSEGTEQELVDVKSIKYGMTGNIFNPKKL